MLIDFTAAIWHRFAMIGHKLWCNTNPVVDDAQGLKRTIDCMDEEHPRTEASINNRSQLRQMLNIEGLYRQNKVSLTVSASGP